VVYETFLLVVWTCYGTCIGSFLNVLIYRMPNGIPLVEKSRSFCPACGSRIVAWQNIPLVSFTILRGKCASCRIRIPLRYPAIEAITGGAFLLLALGFGFPEAFALAVLTSCLVVAACVDWGHGRIPVPVVLVGLVGGLAASAAWPSLQAQTLWQKSLTLSVTGAMLLGGLMLLSSYPAQRRVGYALLAAMAGSFLGSGLGVAALLAAGCFQIGATVSKKRLSFGVAAAFGVAAVLALGRAIWGR
jgi:leader peptidase (prepilin peptidase)/N-methyltransferase